MRLEKRLRIADMAEKTGIPLGSFSCLETGRYRMSLENLFRILLVLGKPVSEVWPDAEPVEKIGPWTIMEALDAVRRKLPKPIGYDDILNAVASLYTVSIADVKGPSRSRRIAQARAVGAILVRRSPGLTLARLSRLLNRDTSSLSHQIRRARMQPREAEFWRLVELAQERLNEN